MRILYFTSSYPFGSDVIWKTHEINAFKSAGFHVTVIPFNHSGEVSERLLLEGIDYERPLQVESVSISLKKKFLSILFSKKVMFFIKEMMRSKAFMNKLRLISWIIESYTVKQLYSNARIAALKGESDEDTIWYFFWARGSSLIIPLLGPRKFKVACRFHGYDLYKYRSSGYIPYQSEQVKFSDLLLPCSEDGMKYLLNEYSIPSSKIYVARLGARTVGESKHSDDGVLRIVSCSRVIALKRLNILLEALQHLDFHVVWTHLGDGEMLAELKNCSTKMVNKNVDVKFMGWLAPEEVMQFYRDSSCDLFINVSSSEGIPVSVMEALASGIPVFATDVGGTSEIVDEKVGVLLPSEISPRELANRIQWYYHLPDKTKMEYRRSAFERYKKSWDAYENALQLSSRLKKIA